MPVCLKNRVEDCLYLTKNTLPPKCAQIAKEKTMELVCEKYKDKVDSDNPVCRHPDDFCQTRSGCIIHYMEKERERARRKKIAPVKKIKQVGK